MGRTSTLIKDLKRLNAKYLEELPSQDVESIYQHLHGPYDEFGVGPKGYGTEHLTKEMDRIIRGAPRTMEDLTTFRGTTVEGATPRKRYPFTTSYDPDVAETYTSGWVGHDITNPALMLEIEVPKGSPQLMFDEKVLEQRMDQLMPFGDESELLLPHGELELLRKYADKPETFRSIETLEGGEPTIMKRELKRYIPPYKARGGLVNGNA